MMHKRSAWLVVLVVALSLVTAASSWSLAQPPLPEQADEPVVVRLYFESREQLNAVAAEYDVWRYDTTSAMPSSCSLRLSSRPAGPGLPDGDRP